MFYPLEHSNVLCRRSEAKGHIDIQYCWTDLMTDDYMTKPLYGKKFVQYRQKIMNLPLMAQLLMEACVVACEG
jgi:hypothetical protein